MQARQALNRADILLLRRCSGFGGFVEGSKPQLHAEKLAGRGLLKLSYTGAPGRSLSFTDLRRPLIYELTEAGRTAARQRLPMKKKGR